ncbi:hypothetical protein LTR62_006979 [Meristemomyces frigidus]|uniref:PH domain-containing protein n=1 Tax=Meristemomyces frigidus TaxID=1508187 RepID=A0AAN7TDB9_9PEZI|nr:hypothetical protein LTR62_006979 [Meristemomyces frigidus]
MEHGRSMSGLTPIAPVAHHLDVPYQESSPLSAIPTPPASQRQPRPPLSMKGSSRRPPSVFGSLRSSLRSSTETSFGDAHEDEKLEPLSTTSSTAPSVGWADGSQDPALSSRQVIHHGEVQTSAGMFRKKKEYLVLTETHIIRYKSQSKAAENIADVPYPLGRSPTIKHTSSQSAGSHTDLQTLSDASGDRDGRVPLRQVVSVHRLDDGKPYFAIEVCYLDEENGQASAVTLQFNIPEERDVWLSSIRSAVRLRPHYATTISAYNLENAARIIERDNDYDPSNCAIYKVVQRHSSKSSGRSSSDDLAKVASNVCFLAIGVHKVHLIQVAKPVARASSPSLVPNNMTTSYGILTLTAIKVGSTDDTFELTFRQPLQRPRSLYLASVACHEIITQLHFAENYLRPEAGERLFNFKAPPEVEMLLPPPVTSDEDNACLDRTLTAYCVAYGVNAGNVRYTITQQCEDAPRFELLPPADARRPEYGPIELLAIARALRYNDSFGSISLAGICLDSLNGLHDNYGREHVCSRTKKGTPIKLSGDELGRSCLLVQEVRALAAASKRLRRMDFSDCVTNKYSTQSNTIDEEGTKTKDIGCGVVEALFPLCKHQTTNVDWICLNGINLSETDLDYLVGAAVEKSCHLRAVELSRCGLNDRSMGLILDALRAQDNTLEAIEIAGNAGRLNPVTFDSQMAMFGFIRKLDLSYVSRTSGAEPLLQAETMLMWRLQELRLTGTTLNSATVDAIATYLAHPQSSSLHALYLDSSYLTGRDVATLLHSMSHNPFEPRDLHLDISQCNLGDDVLVVTKAISEGLTPLHLTMRAIEYRDENTFRKLLNALTMNKSIRYLDISHTALPGEISDDTCRALERLLADNDTLHELDMSGEESRLASSRFGSGINQALAGLKKNKSLQCFRIEKQKLGLQGASTLADVLKVNNTLRELHCGNNEIPLHGFTDLVDSLTENTTLLHLPTMDDGRAAAFRSADVTMKMMSDADDPLSPRSPSSYGSGSFQGSSAVKRSFTSLKRSATRSASSYVPHRSMTPSSRVSTASPMSSPMSFTLPSPRNKQASQSPTSAPLGFTIQDVQSTHRLLGEQWDRQCLRLAESLERNWCLFNGTETPHSSTEPSHSTLPQYITSDTTPRAERQVYFDSPVDDRDPSSYQHQISFPAARPAAPATTEKKEGGRMSFKQFILDADDLSVSVPLPVDRDRDRGPRHLRIHTADHFEVGGGTGVGEEGGEETPTQATFEI